MSEESHYDQLMKDPEFAKAMVKETANLEREICAEQLQAMEARAVAAERALADLKAYADDTFKLWDNDQDSKVGKRLMWMSGTGNRDYEPNLTHIHKISTTAARELMRKADSFDDIYEALPDDSPAKFPETGVSVLDEVKDLLKEVEKLHIYLNLSESMTARFYDLLYEVAHYQGGADHAMADEYVVDRVMNGLELIAEGQR